MPDLRTLIVTGASGFIGRHFVLAAMHRFRVYCLARRSQAEVEIPQHPNIQWIQTDIADSEQMRQLAAFLRDGHEIEAVLHLAGYYDFSLKDNPAYDKANVQGTENILDLAQKLGVPHFIFSSSLAACAFTPPGTAVNEATPLVAEFPYARSKRKAEALIQTASAEISASIVRLAAVFSDWCEYPPLYSLLETWLSRSPLSRIIGGRGHFSLPYIHIKDVITLFLVLLEKGGREPGVRIFLASPAGSVSHAEIYQTACSYSFNRPKKALYIPKWLAWAGLSLRCCFSRMAGIRLFERPWMARYIDAQLSVDPQATYEALNWKPRPRYALLRRLLFIIENKKIHAYSYHFRNQVQMQRFPERKTAVLFTALCAVREDVLEQVLKFMLAPSNILQFFHCQRVDSAFLKALIDLVYQLIMVSVRSRNRSMISDHLGSVAGDLFAQGFSRQELVDFVLLLGNTLIQTLRSRSEIQAIQREVVNSLELTVQYCVDEIRDVCEELQEIPRLDRAVDDRNEVRADDLQRILGKMESLSQLFR